MTGNARVEVASVFVNSSSATAVRTTGNARIMTGELHVAGGTSFGSTPGCTGTLTRLAAPFADPMSSLRFPSIVGMTDLGAASVNDSRTLSPGYYSGGIRLTGRASVTLAPGVYLIGGSGLTVSSGDIRGQGVTLVFLGGSMTLTGGSTVTLSPTTTGDLADMVIVQPPSNASAMKLSGGSSVAISGNIYAPAAAVTLTGNGSAVGTGPVFGESLIARCATLTGNGSIKIGRTLAGREAPLPRPHSQVD